ncbi:MAG: hypothetical protein ACRBCL_15630 [Maritimibacter sp.]
MEGRAVPLEDYQAELETFLNEPLLVLDAPQVSYLLEDLLLDDDADMHARHMALATHLAACLIAHEESDSAGLVWAEWRASFLAGPAKARAIWMNAAREALQFGLFDAKDIEAKDCVALPVAEVLEPLRAFVRTADEAVLRAISLADYGSDADKHFDALKTVVFEDGCILPSDDTWFPLEVVQLTSHVPSERGHPVALSILLATAVQRGDEYGDIAYRWVAQAPDWASLPDKIRIPIMAAVRHIFQSDVSFMEYDSDLTPERLPTLLIP